MKKIIIGFLLGVGAFGLFSMKSQVQQAGLTPGQQAVLNRLSVVQIPDGQGGTVEALRVTSNFQVVNGLGYTDTTNALGNLIVGYSDTNGDVRTGSHNFVLGNNHTFGSHSSIIAGLDNSVLTENSAILSGLNNIIHAGAQRSAILSGNGNQLLIGGLESAIISGESNAISSDRAAVVAGRFNIIDGTAPDINSGRWSVIVGGGGGAINGNINAASVSVLVGGSQNIMNDGISSSVLVGGQTNRVAATTSVVVGGHFNQTNAAYSVISGGANRTADDDEDWVAGSLVEDN